MQPRTPHATHVLPAATALPDSATNGSRDGARLRLTSAAAARVYNKSAVSGQRSAVSGQRSAVSGQRSAVSGMTCARRPAGARPPASPTSSGSRRPDARTGRARARLSLLPVLALLLGALGLGHAKPASADVLVSNMGQQSRMGSSSLQSDVTAQGFTTGSWQPGYSLQSIEALWNSPSATQAVTLTAQQIGTIRVELWSDSSDAPGEKVASLTVPSTVAFAANERKVFSFGAPAGTNLSPDTKYHVLFYSTTSSTNLGGMVGTNSTNHDAGAATGWSIAAGGHWKTSNTPAGGGFSPGFRIKIRVNGEPPPPATPTNLGVTPDSGQLNLTWTAPPGPATGYDVHYTSVLNRGALIDTAPALDNPLGNKPVAGWVALPRSGTATSQTISSLPPGTAYRVRVRARNSAGVSDWLFGTGTTSGAAPVVVPAPANAIWSATLTADQAHSFIFGCDNADASQDNCSTATVLTDDDFTYQGLTHTVRSLYWQDTSLRLVFGLTGLSGAAVKRDLSGLTLNVQGNEFAISDAEAHTETVQWIYNPATGWTDGLKVSVSLTPTPPPTVSLSASPNPVREGSPVTVTATLSAALGEVRIPVYSAAAGAFDIVIPAGQTTGTHEFTAPQLEDGEMKQFQIAIEWWRILKSTPLSPKGSQSIAGVTVLDENADPHRVSVSDASGTEMENGYPRLCFAFTLNRAAPHRIWVGYRTENGTATAGQDYQGVIGSPVIPFEPGETYKRKCITILDDNVEDSGETFSMVLVNPHGAILDRARGTGTIYNHEPTSLSALTAEGASDEEGPFAALDIGSFAPATTAYAVTVPHGTTHVRLTPKSLNRYLTITTGLDGKAKSQVPFGGGTGPAVALAVGENILVVKTLLASGQRQTYRVTVTRQAAPAAVAVSLSATPNPVQEGSPVTVRATLATALAEAVTIPLTVTRGTSEDGDHGSLASITIPAGFTSATGTVSTVEDDDGDDETFTVALGSLPSGLAAGAASSVLVTITDSGLQKSTEPLTAAFGNVPSEHDGTAFTFDLTLSEAPGAGNLPVAVSFKVAPGTASVSGSGTRYTVTVTPKAANAWKDVTITLAGGRACAEAGAICTADGRALTNTSSVTVGGPVRIRVAGARAKEGKDASLDFAVTLNRAVGHEVSVDYATEDGTAAAGADYTAVSGTLVFAAGETAKTVSVPLLDDAIDEGRETMRLKLSNPKGAYLRNVHRQAKGVIRNEDPLQSMWLARFGRTVAADAVASVTARLETPRDAGSHLTLAGQRLSLSGDGTALAGTLTGLARAFGAREVPANDDPFARHDLTNLWNESTTATGARRVTGRELLLGSSFRAVLGHGAGSQWTSWGQGASVSRFSAAAPGLSLSGESATGSMGMDWERGRLLMGLAMTHTVGAGTAEDEGWRYELGSTATMAMPYARLALSERVSAWGLAGTGTGRLTIDIDGSVPQSYRTDLAMTLAAAGVRGDLVEPAEAGGFALALKADAFWVRTESGRVTATEFGNLAAARGESSRVRAVLDGSHTFSLAGGATLAPSLEFGLRHDGGDAETGRGLEFGTGLGFADPSRGLDMTLKAHGLAVHSQDGYEEWGVTGQLRLVPGGSGRGLMASLAPSWGVDPSGSERLWALSGSSGLAANGEAVPSSRLDGELGYGMALLGDRFTGTPHVGFGFSDAAREYRMGWRLTPAAGDDLGFEVRLDATRREAANDNGAEHGVMLRSLIRW